MTFLCLSCLESVCLLFCCLFGSLFSYFCFFFFMQKTAYDFRISDWSSDVCSSDLHHRAAFFGVDLERVEMRILTLVGIVAIDLEFLDGGRALGLVDRARLLRAAVLGQDKLGHIAVSLMQSRAD